MKELLKEYEKSIVALNNRINELSKIKGHLSETSPVDDLQIEAIIERIKPLRMMLYELKEVVQEIDHYYDRSWWRSEKYTCNRPKSRKFIFVGFIYDESRD